MRRPRLVWRLFATYLVVIVLASRRWAHSPSGRARLLPDQTERDLQARALVERGDRPLWRRRRRVRSGRRGVRLAPPPGPASRSSRPTSRAPLGTVLAESETTPDELGNHSDRPEFGGPAGRVGTGPLQHHPGQRDAVRRRPCRAGRRVVAVVRAATPLAADRRGACPRSTGASASGRPSSPSPPR